VQGTLEHCRGVAGRLDIHRQPQVHRDRNVELQGTSVYEHCVVTEDEQQRNISELRRPYHNSTTNANTPLKQLHWPPLEWSIQFKLAT